jgi:nucleotide-binding universal stress UspA family protein
MSMLRSILLATDFRESSDEASKVASCLSRMFDSRLTVLHAFHTKHDSPSLLHLERQWAQERLQEFTDQLKGENATVAETLLEAGHPAELIVRTAQEIDVDLVLIGAGERTHKDTFAPGPIAQSVLERAEQAVLAVRPGTPQVEFKNILCAVDHSDVSVRALRNAIGLARAFKSHLTVLTVVAPMRWLSAAVETGRLAGAQNEHDQSWQDQFGRLLLSLEFGDISWDSDIRHGIPADEIIAAAQRHQADLLVMGSTGRSGLVRILLGSVTRRVLQRLPCSILTVKSEDAVTELLEVDLRHIKLLTAEGRGLLEARDYYPALRKFNQVLARNPFHFEALASIAEIQEHLGHAEKANRCRKRLELLARHKDLSR